VFRTLKRRLIASQTIEPTQVAGFNQFFDDPEGTDAWRYGVGIDQRFGPQLYAGSEFSKRQLLVPSEVRLQGVTIRLDEEEEQLLRFYAYWTPLA
jgi:hypothetical protein